MGSLPHIPIPDHCLYLIVQKKWRTRPTVVEAAEGRLHNGGWEGGKRSHTTHPR